MADEKDNNKIDELIENTHSLEQEVSQAEEEVLGKKPEPKEKKVPIEQSDTHSLNAAFQVRVSDDKMHAYGTFIPAFAEGKPLNGDDVTNLLKEKGISFGIDWERIGSCVKDCNQGKRLDDIEIATGKLPSEEVPEHIVINNQLTKEARKIHEKSKQIDYKEYTPFILVKKHYPIAKRIRQKPGEKGVDVFGTETDFPQKDVSTHEPGENITEEMDIFRSSVDGRFVIQDKTFFVNEVLEIKENVDYHTGHIAFPGDVIINGTIRDGFRVYSGGSVYCKQTMDASEVHCKKNLIITQGIIGRQKGYIRVGGSIESVFIEHCKVESKGDITIQKSIGDSDIYTKGSIIMGDKGHIVGGELHTIGELVTHDIGSNMHTQTLLQCGVNFFAERKLAYVRKKHTAFSLKLQQIEAVLKEHPNQRLQEVSDKLKKSVAELSNAMSQLLEQVDSNEDASITITGTLYPGVFIEICHIDFPVVKEMKGIKLKLNKTKGEVIAESLSGRTQKR